MSESQAVPAELEFDLADRLAKSLRVSGVQVKEMRDVLGVSSSTMTNYLSGSTRPKDGMLRQWAFRCGSPITFEWLAYGLVSDGPDPSEQGSSSFLWDTDATVVPLRRVA